MPAANVGVAVTTRHTADTPMMPNTEIGFSRPFDDNLRFISFETPFSMGAGGGPSKRSRSRASERNTNPTPPLLDELAGSEVSPEDTKTRVRNCQGASADRSRNCRAVGNPARRRIPTDSRQRDAFLRHRSIAIADDAGVAE